MPTGRSLHIGVNQVDLQHYGQLTTLFAADNDARDMQQLAKKIGYKTPELLLDSEATSIAVLDWLAKWAKKLKAGDILLLTYSGHGGQVQDIDDHNNRMDEQFDETWCLYDRQLLDDEIHEALKAFKKGVRIVVISDSCHSGTVTRAIPINFGGVQDPLEAAALYAAQNNLRIKAMTSEQVGDVLERNYEKSYQPVYKKLAASAGQPQKRADAAVKLFAACQDDEVTYDGILNGLFTARLLRVVNDGFSRVTSPDAFFEELRAGAVRPMPNLLKYGYRIPAFETHFPFQVEIEEAAVVSDDYDDTGKKDPPAEGVSTPKITTAPPPSAPGSAGITISVEFLDREMTAAGLIGLLPSGRVLYQIRYHSNRRSASIVFAHGQYSNAWDVVYLLLQKAEAAGIHLSAEPSAIQNIPLLESSAPARDIAEEVDYWSHWPRPEELTGKSLLWHLDADHSQLADARDAVMAEIEAGNIPRKSVRIAHIDTGYHPDHPSMQLNPNLNRELARSFVDYEPNNKAIDIHYSSNEAQGHGLGTLCLLAGWKVPAELTFGIEADYLGAVPFAEIIPMRIAEGPALFDSTHFCEAVEYAIATGCEVITMSMGGKPSAKMARVINKAYEAGIVIVTAAGNNFTQGIESVGPKTVVWPARFARVIAACGACYNHFPYDFDAQERLTNSRGGTDIRHMQGNWGPVSAMNFALAAYTPNTLWAKHHEAVSFKKRGGGTSSATPQIAAAAALYIMKHRPAMEAVGYYQPDQKWKKVEAVRRALFNSAFLPDFRQIDDPKRFYGNGILRADNALNQPVLQIDDSMKMPPADSSWLGILEALRLFLNRRRAGEKPVSSALLETLAFELVDVMMSDPQLAKLHDSVSFEGQIDDAAMAKIMEAVKNSNACSATLKGMF